MFGFIWATIVGIGAIVSGSKLAAQNNNSMNRAIKKDKKRIREGETPHGTYWKFKNGRYGDYTYDGKQVFYKKDSNGDCLITDIYGENIYKNLTEEQRNINFNNNKQNKQADTIAVSTDIVGRSLYKITKIGEKKYIDRGIQYRNIKTNEIYYIVRLPLADPKVNFENGKYCIDFNSTEWIEYYMTDNGKLVSITDKQRKEDPTFDKRKDIKKFIKYFNSLQRGVNGGWHNSIRKEVPKYLNNKMYAIYYYCTEYYPKLELNKENYRNNLII